MVRPTRPRHGHREGRSIDPGRHTDHHLAGDQGGAGVARGHHGLRPAILDQAGTDTHRRVALASHRERGLVHADDLAGMDDLDPVPDTTPGLEVLHLLLQDRPAAHEEETELTLTGRQQRALNHGPGGVVAAHRIDGDHGWGSR